jgi:hypothetical protein
LIYLAVVDFMAIIVPLTTTGLFIVVAFVWGWLSDGPCRGARWPFIYSGAVITVSLEALHLLILLVAC